MRTQIPDDVKLRFDLSSGLIYSTIILAALFVAGFVWSIPILVALAMASVGLAWLCAMLSCWEVAFGWRVALGLLSDAAASAGVVILIGRCLL